MKTELDFDEKIVIKTSKGHFDRLLPGYSDNERLETVMSRVVYMFAKRIDPLVQLKFIRELLLKTGEWSAEQWENKTGFLMQEAQKELFWNPQLTFLDALLYRHYSEIRFLKVCENGETLLDLDLTEEEIARLARCLTND